MGELIIFDYKLGIIMLIAWFVSVYYFYKLGIKHGAKLMKIAFEEYVKVNEEKIKGMANAEFRRTN